MLKSRSADSSDVTGKFHCLQLTCIYYHHYLTFFNLPRPATAATATTATATTATA